MLIHVRGKRAAGIPSRYPPTRQPRFACLALPPLRGLCPRNAPALVPLRFLALTLIVCAALALSACKTTLSRARVEPFALMQEDAAVFFLLPVQAHFDTTLLIAQKLFPAASQKDLRQAVSRVQTVYGALASDTNSAPSRVQLVITGSFPRAALNAVFAPKNGWTQISADFAGTRAAWYKNAREHIEVYAEIPGMLVVSDNVASMISLLKESFAAGSSGAPDGTRPQWFHTGAGGGAGEDALFFAPRAARIIEKAASINIPALGALSEASVEAKLSAAVSETRILALDIDLKDRRAAGPAMLLLSLVDIFSEAQVAQEGAHIRVTMPVHETLLTNFLL